MLTCALSIGCSITGVNRAQPDAIQYRPLGMPQARFVTFYGAFDEFEILRIISFKARSTSTISNLPVASCLSLPLSAHWPAKTPID